MASMKLLIPLLFLSLILALIVVFFTSVESAPSGDYDDDDDYGPIPPERKAVWDANDAKLKQGKTGPPSSVLTDEDIKWGESKYRERLSQGQLPYIAFVNTAVEIDQRNNFLLEEKMDSDKAFNKGSFVDSIKRLYGDR